MKITANIKLNGERVKAFSSKIRNKINHFALAISIKYNISGYSQRIREEITGIVVEREVMLPLFTGNMI